MADVLLLRHRGPALHHFYRLNLREGRPLLAISAYHKQSDLWQLALQVRVMEPDDALFLRPHADEGFDTVLYGVPPERLVRA